MTRPLLTRIDRARSVDVMLSDHIPVCPRCGDLSGLGATRCESCAGPLVETGAYANRRDRCVLRDEQGRFFRTQRPARMDAA